VTSIRPKRLHKQASARKPKKVQTESIETHRRSLKSNRWDEWEKLETDQKKGVPPPQPQKPFPKNGKLISLVSPEKLTIGTMQLIESIRHRRSRRVYTDQPFTLEELSFILWATQGISQITPRDVSKVTNEASGSTRATRRTVPSAGARHPFETYLLVNRVTGVEL